MLYKARNDAIKFYDDYSLMMPEAKTKSEQCNTTERKGNASTITDSSCTSKSR